METKNKKTIIDQVKSSKIKKHEAGIFGNPRNKIVLPQLFSIRCQNLVEMTELDPSNKSKACVLHKNSKFTGRTCTQKLLSTEKSSLPIKPKDSSITIRGRF